MAQVSWAQSELILPGDKLPSLSLPDVTGEVISLNEYRGHSVLLMWFDRCGDCRAEVLQWQQNFSHLLSNNTVFIPVVWSQRALTELMPLYQQGNKLSQDNVNVYFYKPEFIQAWWFNPAPALMLIDPDGRVEDIFLHDLNIRKDEINQKLGIWLSNQAWLDEEE